MNPVQSNLIPLFNPAGNPPPDVASNSLPPRSASDSISPAWYRRTNPAPTPTPPVQPRDKPDVFFVVIDKLIDQLDTLIGQLLGNGTTPGSGGGTSGTGGATSGAGTTPDTGGATLGTGGATSGTGSATSGTGGATPGTGGVTPGGIVSAGPGDGVATFAPGPQPETW